MEDTWVPMMRQYEHGPGSHMVNTRFRDRGPFPDPARPSATIIKVTFNEPDESGMGSHQDAAIIDDAWDALAPRLAAECSAEFVGRLRHEGQARILIYSPAGARPFIESAARKSFPHHQLAFQHRDDPKWDLYRASLPTPSEERVALDLLVVQALAQHGDPLKPKRDVRHFAYFPSKDAADKFARQVSPQGFHIELEKCEDNRYRVLASRDDSVQHPEISSITGPLADLAHSLGGEYDGWEARLVKKTGLLNRLFKR